MRIAKTTRLGCVALTTVLMGHSAFGQALADVVPGDAVAYAGWRGTLDPGPAYAGSHLAAVLKDSNFTAFVDETLPAMAQAIGKREPNERAVAVASLDVLRQVIRHPAAAFVTAPKGKQPCFALCVRAGDDSGKLLASIQQLIAQLPPQAKAQVVQQGDLVGIAFNSAADEGVLAAQASSSLAEDAKFKADLAQVAADPTFVAYGDLRAARQLLDNAVQGEAGDDNFAAYRRAMDAAGLSNVKSAIFAAAFKGHDWETDSFIEAPAPRTGLLALSAAKAFNADLLKRIPAAAYTASAARLDVAKLVAEVRTIAAAVDPQYGDMVEKALGAGTMAIGKNVMTDLLEPLGDEWAVYTAPEVGGSAALGTVVVNKLDNPMKEKQAMASLSVFLSNTSHTFLRKQNITLEGRSLQVDGISVYYIAAPLVAPAWAVKDGFLYFGLYPQTVLDAVRYNGRGIAEGENFTRTISGLGAHPPMALSYTDTRPTLPDGYSTAMMLGRGAVGLGDMFLAPTAEPFLPPMSDVLREAAPVGSISWADDAGLHGKSLSPFPGAEGIATLSLSNLYVTNVPMMVSILLPSLNRAREAANRVKSASNLRQIGLASMMYANDNRGTLPSDLAAMAKNEDLAPDVFISPRGNDALPQNVHTMSPDELGTWMNAHSSYAWLGKGQKEEEIKEPARTPLAYEKPAGLSDGINILYADGHVEFVAMPDAMKQLSDAGVANP